MIKLRYIYSACIVTETADVKILHDPWFTEGAYDGSWYQWPRISDPIQTIGDVDIIYISHIHPDHYDPKFLKQYMSSYGEKKLLIAQHNPCFLYNKAVSDGFDVLVVNPDEKFNIGDTSIAIIPHISEGSNNIDSACIITHSGNSKESCIVNLNDCLYDERFYFEVRRRSPSQVDILCLTYAGAGPYPQCFYDEKSSKLVDAATRKKELFLKRYVDTIEFFNPSVALPFAGQYVLGGLNASLNKYKGGCDAVETLQISERSVVLEEGGQSFIDTDGNRSGIRSVVYDENEMARYALDLPKVLPTDVIVKGSVDEMLPIILRLSKRASKNARSRITTKNEWWYIFDLGSEIYIAINTVQDECIQLKAGVENFQHNKRFIVVRLDGLYFLLLIASILHWNNAVVGSWLRFTRSPDIYEQDVQTFLNFMHI